jgi:hypothetical protein
MALVARGIWEETALSRANLDLTDSANPSVSAFGRLPQAAGIHVDLDEPSSHDRNGSRRLDRYGNPIETANGDYRIDPRGEVYERHSPDTAVPRLPVPST